MATMFLVVAMAGVALAGDTSDNSNLEIKVLTGDSTSGRTVSFPQTKTFSHNDIPVWAADLPGARMQNFPAHYLSRFQILTADSMVVPQGAVVSYWCASNGPCDVAVFLYECSPCVSLKGGLPAQLVVDGFQRTRCAPTFTTGAVGGATHRMTAFVKTIGANSGIDIVVPGDAEFAAFGLSNGGGLDCRQQTSQSACEDGNAHCSWFGQQNECKLTLCVSKGPTEGAGGSGCDIATCVHNELGAGPQ